ncbi:MAG: Gfo/Idh/MocA family oxidoreductase [Phycisphaeraceae bacterium]
MPTTRRQFIRTTANGAAITALPFARSVFAQDTPSDTVIVGVMGMGRGASLAGGFESQPNSLVKYVCDVDENRANQAANNLEKAKGRRPQVITDFQKMLDDPKLDAFVCAAPNHWHAPATILACKAGKHVYVEKPCSHNAREGELQIEAARKYKRIVQMGSQRRSFPKIIEGIELLHAGEIGRVYYSRAWYANSRGAIGKVEPAEVPANFNYDLWQGPAPRAPYRTNVIPYNWHWFWHYGGGELANNGIHALDLSRWGLGVDFPTRVTAGGGRYHWDDAQETPDTMTCTFDFPDKKSILWEGLSCNRLGIAEGFGASFHGEKGSLMLGSSGYSLYDGTGRKKKDVPGPGADGPHFEDFLSCIRAVGTDGPTKLPNADIERGHRSTLLCHLGNIAYRTGRTLNCDPKNGHIKDDKEAMGLWSREYEKGWEPKV